MAFQSAPDCAEILLRAVRGGQNCFNTFYVKFGTPYDQADLDALSSAFDAWVGASWLPLQAGNYEYVGTTVRGLTSSIDLISEDNTSAGAGGAGLGEFSNNASLAVKRRSAYTGRGARGRIFLPPPPASARFDDNTVTTTFAAAIEAALNALEPVFTPLGAFEVILHRVAAGVPLPLAVAYGVVEYVVVDRTIDSMRRRLPGRGA